MLRLNLLTLTMLCAFVPTLCQGALIITVNDATVAPGGTAFVDVLVESDGTNFLQDFGFEYQITTGGTTRLEFTDPQPDPQLTDPNYVFFGDSDALISAFPVGTVSSPLPLGPNNTFIGADSTNSFNDVTVTTPVLLARLEVNAATTLAPVSGDTFFVTLDASLLNIDTYFFDAAFNPLTIDMINSDFTGTVTVGQVPEPASATVLAGLIGGFVWSGSRRRRRDKKRPQPEPAT